MGERITSAPAVSACAPTAPQDPSRLLLASLATANASAVDVRVLASLLSLWQEFDRRSEGGVINLTLYELGKLTYTAAPSGKQRRLLRESLERLRTTSIVGGGHASHGPVVAEWEQLWAVTQAPIDVMAVATRRGDQLRVRLGAWLTSNAAAGAIQPSDLAAPPVQGLALRLWLAIQAFQDPNGELIHSDPLYAALGRDASDVRWARRILRPAATRLTDADPSLVDVAVQRSGDAWEIVARHRADPTPSTNT